MRSNGLIGGPRRKAVFTTTRHSSDCFIGYVGVLDLCRGVGVELVVLFLLTTLSFVNLFFVVGCRLMSRHTMGHTSDHFRLVRGGINCFFGSVRHSTLALGSSLCLLGGARRVRHTIVLGVRVVPFLSSIKLMLSSGGCCLFSQETGSGVIICRRRRMGKPLISRSKQIVFTSFGPSGQP